jgi:hypothetical protein
MVVPRELELGPHGASFCGLFETCGVGDFSLMCACAVPGPNNTVSANAARMPV